MVLTHQPLQASERGEGRAKEHSKTKEHGEQERKSNTDGGVVLCVHGGLEPNQIPKLATSVTQIKVLGLNRKNATLGLNYPLI